LTEKWGQENGINHSRSITIIAFDSLCRWSINPDLSFEPDHPSELGTLSLLQIPAAQHFKSCTISKTVGYSLPSLPGLISIAANYPASKATPRERRATAFFDSPVLNAFALKPSAPER
jgi:hypothetical protein